MKLTSNQSKKEEQVEIKPNILAEIYYKRLDKLDNMLLSLTSITSIIFTVVASVIGGFSVLYLLPIIIPGVFLPIYFGYYKVISCNDYYKSICYRIIGWCFFIDVTLLYFASSIPLILKNIFPYVVFVTPIINTIALIIFRFHTHMIICNIVECNNEILKLSNRLRKMIIESFLYYIWLWYGFFIYIDYIKFASEVLTSENVPLIITIITIIGLLFIPLGIIYFAKKFFKFSKYLTDLINHV